MNHMQMHTCRLESIPARHMGDGMGFSGSVHLRMFSIVSNDARVTLTSAVTPRVSLGRSNVPWEDLHPGMRATGVSY